MKVCGFGAGHAGLVTAACLAEMRNSLRCRDIDPAWLRRPACEHLGIGRAEALPRIAHAPMPLAA